MNPIEKLRSCHPFFRNATPDNFFDYFALVAPHVVLQNARRRGIETDPITPFLAGELGALLMTLSGDIGEDRGKFGLICNYFIDKVIITRNPVIHQVVIFDLLMSPHAYRLPELADSCVFEVHVNADVLREKERCIEESGAPLLAKARVLVRTDLRRDGWHHALLGAGFNPDEPTLWIVEDYLSYMSAADGTHFMSVIASLSAPHSQIFADMFNGRGMELASDGSKTMTAKFFEVNGENGCVFQGLRDWKVELMARRDGEYHYYGTMWDPERLGPWSVNDPKKGELGPWFIARFNKPGDEVVP